MNISKFLAYLIAFILSLAFIAVIWYVVSWVIVWAFGLNIEVWKLALGLWAISIALKFTLDKS